MISRIACPAKINLFLHLTGRRSDGYHLLRSLFAKIDLYDHLELYASEDISCIVSGAEVKNNSVLKTAILLHQHFAVAKGAAFVLKKAIPIGAGLGGGSSNAAAALMLLNQYWQLNLSSSELHSIGLQIGADVPFFLQTQQAALVEGIGEQIKPLSLGIKLAILLVYPGFPCHTANVFRAVPEKLMKQLPPASITDAIFQSDNHLYATAAKLYPRLAKIRSQISQQTGCLAASMSGSGSTLFGLFDDLSAAYKAGCAFNGLWTHCQELLV